MSPLNNKGGEDTGTSIELKVPVLSLENEVNPPKLDEREVENTKDGKGNHRKPDKQRQLDEMLASLRDKIESQQ